MKYARDESLNARNFEDEQLASVENEMDNIMQTSLKGKTVAFFGDSVAYGEANDGKGFGYYINEEEELKSFINAAVSGSVYTSNYTQSNSIAHQMLLNSDKDFDYIILEGGYNDLVAGTTLGTVIENDYDINNLSNSTISGQFERALYYATKIWPNAKIGYIVSYQLPSEKVTYDNSKQLWDMTKKACNKWNVKYLDLFAGKVNYEGNEKTYTELFDFENNSHNYFSTDRLHPVEAGYEFMCPFIAEWMKGLNTFSANYTILNGNVASNINDTHYKKGCGLTLGEGKYMSNGVASIAAPYISDNYGQIIRVKGGSTIGVAAGRNLSYAIYEFNKMVEPSGGQTASAWIEGDTKLNDNTTWIKVVIKNGTAATNYSEFADTDINSLPNALEIRR